MIIEPERSGKSISDVCIAFGISRETWSDACLDNQLRKKVCITGFHLSLRTLSLLFVYIAIFIGIIAF